MQVRLRCMDIWRHWGNTRMKTDLYSRELVKLALPHFEITVVAFFAALESFLEDPFFRNVRQPDHILK